MCKDSLCHKLRMKSLQRNVQLVASNKLCRIDPRLLMFYPCACSASSLSPSLSLAPNSCVCLSILCSRAWGRGRAGQRGTRRRVHTRSNSLAHVMLGASSCLAVLLLNFLLHNVCCLVIGVPYSRANATISMICLNQYLSNLFFILLNSFNCSIEDKTSKIVVVMKMMKFSCSRCWACLSLPPLNSACDRAQCYAN